MEKMIKKFWEGIDECETYEEIDVFAPMFVFENCKNADEAVEFIEEVITKKDCHYYVSRVLNVLEDDLIDYEFEDLKSEWED